MDLMWERNLSESEKEEKEREGELSSSSFPSSASVEMNNLFL